MVRSGAGCSSLAKESELGPEPADSPLAAVPGGEGNSTAPPKLDFAVPPLMLTVC